jgi:cytochrome c biogenesis protein CcdA
LDPGSTPRLGERRFAGSWRSRWACSRSTSQAASCSHSGRDRRSSSSTTRPPGDAIVELYVGVVLGFVAVGLWITRQRVARHLAREETKIRRSSIAGAATIMVVELPTAFPYFAVIAAVVGSGRNVLSRVALLMIFNVAFITPLLLIAATREPCG